MHMKNINVVYDPKSRLGKCDWSVLLMGYTQVCVGKKMLRHSQRFRTHSEIAPTHTAILHTQ